MLKRPKQQRSHSYLPKNVHLRHFTGNNIPMHRHLPYELTFCLYTAWFSWFHRLHMHRHLTSCKFMWNGSVYNIKNTLIIQFLNEIYRLLTKSFRFLPSRIRKNSCSYRPAESKGHMHATCTATEKHSWAVNRTTTEQQARRLNEWKAFTTNTTLNCWVQRTEKGLPAVQN